MDVTALELHAAQAGIRRKVDAGAAGQAKIDIREANAVRHECRPAPRSPA